MRLHSDHGPEHSTASAIPRRQLDLTGLDAQIAAQLQRIAAVAARHPRAVARLRRQLGQVALPARVRREHGLRPLHDAEDDLWSSSNVALLALAAAAAASLALAVSPLPGGYATAPAQPAAVASPPPADHDASRVATAVPHDASHAKAARDRARAARFHSEKSESKTYASAIHLAAERKELEADVALDAGKYALAIELYDLARDGYELARTRSERSAADLDRERLEDQFLADARRSAKAGPGIRPKFVIGAPEECAVAHAVGFGIAAGACSPARRDAELAALTRCRDKVAARYGRVATSCSLAWSDPTVG